MRSDETNMTSAIRSHGSQRCEQEVAHQKKCEVFGSVCGRVAVWVPDAPVRAGCALVRVQRMNE